LHSVFDASVTHFSQQNTHHHAPTSPSLLLPTFPVVVVVVAGSALAVDYLPLPTVVHSTAAVWQGWRVQYAAQLLSVDF